MNNALTHSFSLLLVFLCLLLFLSSCKKDNCPCIPYTDPFRKILIEEFTGHNDGHGAIAMRDFLSIQKKYSDKVIAINIHAGLFALPSSSPPYTADFRCKEGTDYMTFLKVTYNPAGTVNRVGYPNNLFKESRKWSGMVDSLISLPSDVEVKITNQYDPSTRILNTSVTCEFLKPLYGTYKLVLLLTEDSIIAPQKDYSKNPVHVLNYAHRYMLRDGITGSWGDTLKQGLVAEGDSVIKNYSYTLPPNFNGRIPDENHCRVVAYIYNTANYQVLQAEEEKIK